MQQDNSSCIVYKATQTGLCVAVSCATARNMANLKCSDAQQANIVYNYERTKKKPYKTNAAIW